MHPKVTPVITDTEQEGESVSIASRRVIPEDLRTCVIRIYEYDDKNMQGTVNFLYLNEELQFHNLTRLLLLMEDAMDELDIPQATMRSRRFTTEPKPAERLSLTQQADAFAGRKVLATFNLKVIFRQSGSWQGKLSWVEAGREESFRSTLELIKLMDSALPQPDGQQAVQTIKAAEAG